MTTVKKIEQTLGSPDEKKHSTKFNESDSAKGDDPFQSAYIRKVALAKLGNPDKIKITIEAA